MLKRSTLALFLCLPLCAFGASGSLFHSSSGPQSAEVTTWRGERALKIPVQLTAEDWSKAGFVAGSTAPVQTAWLYLTETAFQLQDGAGHALMGGPRTDLDVEMSQCIRMRSLTVSVCATSSFPASKEAKQVLHGSAEDFSWLYYHLAQAGHRAAPAPPGIVVANNNAGPAGTNASRAEVPVLECRLMNPDGTPAMEQPVAAKPAAAEAQPAAAAVVTASAAKPAAEMVTVHEAPAPIAPIAPTAAPSVPMMEAASEPAPPPAPRVDQAKAVRAMAASAQPAMVDAAARQPVVMLEESSESASAAPLPALPIHVREVAALVFSGVGHFSAKASGNFKPWSEASVPTIIVSPMRVAAGARVVVAASIPRPAIVHFAEARAPVAAVAAQGRTAPDDLTPEGAPRGVVPEVRVKAVAPVANRAVASRTVASNPPASHSAANHPAASHPVASHPADARLALLEAEKAARAARLAEMQMNHSQNLAAIPGSAEVKSVPVEKPRSLYAARLTTSTVFSQPTYVENRPRAISNPAGVRPGESFVEVAAPAAPVAQGDGGKPTEEMAQTENPPVHKSNRIVRPAFKSAVLPTVIDNEQ